VVIKTTKSRYPKYEIRIRIQQRQHAVDFLPSAVLGEVNNLVVNRSRNLVQEGWQELDGFLQETPMNRWERELVPPGRY
jgi:hypothetical protein